MSKAKQGSNEKQASPYFSGKTQQQRANRNTPTEVKESPVQQSPVDSTSRRLEEEKVLDSILITSSESKVLQKTIREANETNSQGGTPKDQVRANIVKERQRRISNYEQQLDQIQSQMSARLSFTGDDRLDSLLMDFDVNNAIMELKNQVDFETDETTMHRIIDQTLLKFSHNSLPRNGSLPILRSGNQSSSVTDEAFDAPEINEHFFELNVQGGETKADGRTSEEGLFSAQELEEMEKAKVPQQPKANFYRFSDVIHEDFEGELEGDQESSLLSKNQQQQSSQVSSQKQNLMLSQSIHTAQAHSRNESASSGFD